MYMLALGLMNQIRGPLMRIIYRSCTLALAILIAMPHAEPIAPPKNSPGRTETDSSIKSDGQSDVALKWTGEVVGVHDGDSLTILRNSEVKVKIRLVAIDAPELGQEFGAQSQKQLSKYVLGKHVHVFSQGLDRYGRTLARVVVGNRDVNRSMISTGSAWHYRQYSDSVSLQKAEDRARKTNRGLWSSGTAKPPWEFRKSGRTKTAEPANALATQPTGLTVYITATGTKYHVEGCRYLNKSSKPISLTQATETYDACKVCKPPRAAAVATTNSKPNSTRVDAGSTAGRNSESKLTHWITISSRKRHNSSCRWYMNSKGRRCTYNDGIACKVCGG